MRAARTDLAEAVGRHVRPGGHVYLGNFGAQLFAVGRELVRQGCRDLDVVVSSGGILLDQLIGAGVLRSALFAHCWSPVGPSPTYCFRRAAERGTGPELHELSLGMLTAALTAGAWGVPFAAVPDLAGTGYVDEDWSGGLLATVESPWGVAPVVRAIRPHVAFVHVDRADREGNAIIRTPLGESLVAAQAAEVVVLVAEEVTDDDSVVAQGPDLPGLLVDAVVHHPGAVAPDGAVGRYERDVRAYEAYADSARTADGFARWLEREVGTPAGVGRG